MKNGLAIPLPNILGPDLLARPIFLPAACLLLLCWQICPVCAASPDAEARVTVAPAPSWVSPLAFARPSDADDIEMGEPERLLLMDRQINGQTNEDFVHQARQLLTASGVQNGSLISIDFDPAYQYLTFHWVRLWRGTNSFNRLDRSKFKVIQPERDLDDYLFTGQLAAVLAVEDVRPGDIIDYAYTLRDENLEAKGGKFSDRVLVQSHLPIQRLRTRLLWPAQRLLYINNHQTDAQPARRQRNGLIEFTWNFTNVPAAPREAPLPAWFEPLPWVQLSGFQKWSEVNRWALGVFSNTAPLSAELTAQINQWRRPITREEQVLTVLRFLQEDVRYLGLEAGSGSYLPAAPSLVFSRRFGDCKDKTLLFVTILRALRIEAHPVLVNTLRRQAIESWHPAAAIFDHAMAQVVLPGQGTFWLDPTSLYQRGPLALRSWPEYGFGLVLRPVTTALTAIPAPAALPKTTVTEFWRIGRLHRPSLLRVVTVAEGPDADRLRGWFATTRREEIERERLNFYARDYPAISRQRPLVFVDDEQQNQVQVTEFYVVQKMWDRSSTDIEYHCRFHAHNVDSAMQMPAVLLRTMPLGLAYPLRQIYRAQIELPGPVSTVQPENRTIDNPAFYFHRAIGQSGARISLEWEFATLSDSVPADAMPAYVRQLGQAIDALDYVLYSP